MSSLLDAPLLTTGPMGHADSITLRSVLVAHRDEIRELLGVAAPPISPASTQIATQTAAETASVESRPKNGQRKQAMFPQAPNPKDLP